MPKVLICDKLEKPGQDLLIAAGIEIDNRPGLKGAELKAALEGADGCIVRSGTRLTAELLTKPGKLRAVVRGGVGVDNIDVAAATRCGIIVMNTPDANTISTAEHTISMLMSMARLIPAADASMKAGKWEKGKFLGSQLTGKTLGIIGLGRIGREVARRAALGLGMNVVGYDPVLSPAAITQIGVKAAATVDELLPQCDFVTAHTPLTPETTNLLDTRRIALLPKGARVVNCARGGIYNEEAVAEALTSGHLAGAAFDVFVEEPLVAGHPFLSCPNIVLTPHLGAATIEAQLLVAKESAQLLVDYLTKGQIRYAVNMVALDRAELEEFAPWIDLARRLGILSSQMARGAIKKAELHYRGEIAAKPTRLITSAFAAGLLENHLEQVNIVNARVLATESGMEIIEQSSTQKGDFSSLIKVVLHTETKSYTISATTFGNQYLRLVQIGHYKVDVPLDGVLLIFSHQDVPGLIGFVGNIMGQHSVNIGGMNVGRETQGGEAIGVLNLDALPPEGAVKAMLDNPQITSVSLVKLPGVGIRPDWLG